MENQKSLSAIICNNCSGTGELFGKECKECIGSGYIAKDQDNNEYYLKQEGENLIVTGTKYLNKQTQYTSSKPNNSNQNESTAIIKEDSNAVKLIGNIFFGIILLPLIMVTILYFRNNYILYAIIILLMCFWGFFNIIYLPDNILSPFKQDYISSEVPKDLHWAIQEIKKYTNGS